MKTYINEEVLILNININIEQDYEALSRKAAQIFAKKIKENPTGAFGFATGSSPIGLYKELVRMHKEEGLDFSGITAFNLDEYHPISRTSEHSYYYFMQEHLFRHVNINQGKVNIPDGMAKDTETECCSYEAKIAEAGGIVAQILGIGLNGHIGFNEPGESFEANTRYIPLAEMTLNANAQHFSNPDEMPRHALTMGIRTIMMAKSIILLANGPAKASIMKDAITGAITPLVPASALQLHPSVNVVMDKEAAAFF